MAIVDIYSAKLKCIREIVNRDLGSSVIGCKTRLAEIEAAYVERHGTEPGGVVAIPRLGTRQKEALMLLDGEWCSQIGRRTDVLERLAEFGWCDLRYSPYTLARITEDGKRAQDILAAATAAESES